MKKTLETTSLFVAGILAVTFLVAPTTLRAETAVSTPTKQSITDQEIDLLRQDIREKRRQVVAANVPLTTEESAKFWPIYDQYIAEATKVYDGRLARIKTYAANYASLTDQQATEHVMKLFEADKAIIDLRVKYLSNFEKALSKKKVAMFAQMDRRIQMMMDLQLASMIPLINPK